MALHGHTPKQRAKIKRTAAKRQDTVAGRATKRQNARRGTTVSPTRRRTAHRR